MPRMGITMTLQNNKKYIKTGITMKFALTVMAVIGISAFTFGLNSAAALSYPFRADWEGHDSAKGTSSSLDVTDPSTPVPGTNWWWARTFVYDAVYTDDPAKGAMGAGWAKYIPLGSSTPVKKYIYYKYDVAGAAQAYSIGASTSGGITNAKVEYTSGNCWNRIAGGTTSSECVTGLIQGHAKYMVSLSTLSNSAPGHFSPNQYKTAGGVWQSFTLNGQQDYCHHDKNIQRLVSGSISTFYIDTSGHANSCIGFFDSNLLPG